MKINENILLFGKNVLLVPYNDYHVEKYPHIILRYHSWMQSEELQELTASEPLTLEKEYEMQASWRRDNDKCTFIILDMEIYNKTQNEIDSMIGDTNLFLGDDHHEAEIEIMVAEKSARGKGYGLESIAMMMLYGIEYLHITSYIAKIGQKNTASVRLFNKLGFKETERSQVFDEITMKRNVNDEMLSLLKSFSEIQLQKHPVKKNS